MDDVLEDTAYQGHDDTESDSSEGDSVGQKRDGSFKSIPVAAGRHGKQTTTALKKRRVDRNQEAQHFDAIMETMEADEGRLNIRTIEELTQAASAADGLLKKGDQFGSRQEVLVRITEDNELQQRMYSTHSSKKGGGAKDGQQPSRGQYQARVVVSVCADDDACEYITRASFALDNDVAGESGQDTEVKPWEIMEERKHTCGRNEASAGQKPEKGRQSAKTRQQKSKPVKMTGTGGTGAASAHGIHRGHAGAGSDSSGHPYGKVFQSPGQGGGECPAKARAHAGFQDAGCARTGQMYGIVARVGGERCIAGAGHCRSPRAEGVLGSNACC
jgi:hypothetical protein